MLHNMSQQTAVSLHRWLQNAKEEPIPNFKNASITRSTKRLFLFTKYKHIKDKAKVTSSNGSVISLCNYWIQAPVSAKMFVSPQAGIH